MSANKKATGLDVQINGRDASLADLARIAAGPRKDPARFEKARERAKEKSTVEALIEAGFDRARRSGPGSIEVRCSQCAAAVINGVPAHERGCPNARRVHERDDDFDDTPDGVGEAT